MWFDGLHFSFIDVILCVFVYYFWQLCM